MSIKSKRCCHRLLRYTSKCVARLTNTTHTVCDTYIYIISVDDKVIDNTHRLDMTKLSHGDSAYIMYLITYLSNTPVDPNTEYSNQTKQNNNADNFLAFYSIFLFENAHICSNCQSFKNIIFSFGINSIIKNIKRYVSNMCAVGLLLI